MENEIKEIIEESKEPALSPDNNILICDNLINCVYFKRTSFFKVIHYTESNKENILESIKKSKVKNIFIHCESVITSQSIKENIKNCIDLQIIKNPEKMEQSELIKQLKEIEKKEIKLQAFRTSRPDNTLQYMELNYFRDIMDYAESGKQTKFNRLNKCLNGIHSGLYVIGGGSSVGKTTFCYQLADQLAELGEQVLYFSLEQSTMELITKSITRIRKGLKTEDELDNKTIKAGDVSEPTKKAIELYKKYIGSNMSIIQGNFNCTVDYIKKYIDKYITYNMVKPIVFIDYLQVIAPPDNIKQDIRANIDYNVTELKRITRDYKIPIILISSFNRNNYFYDVSFESFKESSGIEYTADVVLGLQLSVIHQDIFNSSNSSKVNEKRAAMEQAKMEMPRKIELVGLKNRFNYSHFRIPFIYYPQYDYYKEDNTQLITDKKPPKQFNSILDELR